MNAFPISFCTVCMNRLHHLQQTLPVNILDNEDYASLEFVVLDYNSTDGLEAYAKANWQSYMNSGRLVIYTTKEPTYFHRSHSRNLAFKLAAGEVICNIDADNFTGKQFAAYVNNSFQQNSRICLNTIGLRNDESIMDVLGRVCFTKDAFLGIGGYDQAIDSYGFEDYDLINRLELSGIQRVLIRDDHFLHAITHSNKERIKDEYCINHLQVMLLRYINAAASELILLYNNYEFTRVIVVDSFAMASEDPQRALDAFKLPYKYEIARNKWINGEWRQNTDSLLLKTVDSSEHFRYDTVAECFYSNDNDEQFHALKNTEMIEEIVFFYSEIVNRMKMEENRHRKNVMVNEGAFGNGIVFKNFNYNNPIHI
jgi:hypothetical protein